MGRHAKQVTINEMILDTLNTKQNREPKYGDVLKTLGYEIIKTQFSWYGYWGIMLKNGAHLVISKNYSTNRKALFKTHCRVETYDLHKVNFVDLIAKSHRDYHNYHEWNLFGPDKPPRIQLYLDAKEKANRDFIIANLAHDDLLKKQKEFERTEEYYKDRMIAATKSRKELEALTAFLKTHNFTLNPNPDTTSVTKGDKEN